MDPGNYINVRLSPSGDRLVVVKVGFTADERNLWVYDIARQTLTKITFEAGDRAPIWTPDGQQIVFWSDRRGEAGEGGLFRMRADGTGAVERLTTSATRQSPLAVSADGKTIVLVGGSRVGTLSMEGQPLVAPLLPGEGYGNPRISPDGEWIAYEADDQVFIGSFPEMNERLQISRYEGEDPIWGPDGSELFYMSGENVMVVPIVETDPRLRAGTPRVLLAGPFFDGGGVAQFDVAPDGQRFVMQKAFPPLSYPHPNYQSGVSI